MNRLLFLYWGNLTNHLCKKTRLSLAIEEREEKSQKKEEHWKGEAKWKEVWKASDFFLVKPIKEQDKATTVETQCSYHSSPWKERKDLLRTPKELLLHDWTQKQVSTSKKYDFFALKNRRGRGENTACLWSCHWQLHRRRCLLNRRNLPQSVFPDTTCLLLQENQTNSNKS